MRKHGTRESDWPALSATDELGRQQGPSLSLSRAAPSQHALLRVIYTARLKRMCITIVMIIMFCSRKRFQNLSHHTRSCLETAGQSTRKCRADNTPHEPRGAANHKQHCPSVRPDEALLQGKPGLRELVKCDGSGGPSQRHRQPVT